MNKLLFTLIPPVVSSYMKLANKTSMSVKRVNHQGILNLYSEKKPFIYAFWHNRIFMAPFGLPSSERYVPIISKSKDGELIAKTVSKLGVSAYARGSSSRGGKEALNEAVRHLNMTDRGYVLAITPDGPRGPKYQAKEGVAVIARKTMAPIVCFAYGASKKIVFGSWDNFIVPLPCSDMVYVYSDPFYYDNSLTLEENLKIIENRLVEVTSIADGWEF